MSKLQLVVRLIGVFMLYALLSRFQKKCVELSRANLKLAMFPSSSAKKTSNIYAL